jgi:tricorn protease
MLDRRVFQLLGNREAATAMVPWRANFGPKCVVMNAVTVSAGENFAYFFRKSGVGKLVGSRTWGGIIGLAGNPAFIDGGLFNIPNAPFFGSDGRWMIEGHGIEPDIPVENDPTRVAAGEDPQLDRAIRLMLDELRTKSYKVPPMPPARNRAGIGVPKNER